MQNTTIANYLAQLSDDERREVAKIMKQPALRYKYLYAGLQYMQEHTRLNKEYDSVRAALKKPH